ncbi:MAG: hypothetical protein LAT80_15295 [Balneolaceae bacterium]|nr:hypothetical protein [Balneolaceae bacterium]
MASDVDLEVSIVDLKFSNDLRPNHKIDSELATSEEEELFAEVICNCARITWAIIGGNSDCRASNTGNTCGGGPNFQCRDLNDNC